MDVREKLIEILRKPIFPHELVDPTEAVADYLLANGVTVQENVKTSDELLKQLKNAPITTWKEEPSIEIVQEWISVKDRLPEEKVNCIVYYRHAYCDNDGYWAIGFCCYDGEKFLFDPAYKVTHWMQMPEPPEEGTV